MYFTNSGARGSSLPKPKEATVKIKKTTVKSPSIGTCVWEALCFKIITSNAIMKLFNIQYITAFERIEC